MKAITLTQPWAQLVVLGAKTIETRSWSTTYRAQIGIHAAKTFPNDARYIVAEHPFTTALGTLFPADLPTGVIIGVAEITACYQFTDATIAKVRAASKAGELPPYEADFGDFSAGRYGFKLSKVRRLADPVPARGMLNLWDLPADVEHKVREQLTRAIDVQRTVSV